MTLRKFSDLGGRDWQVWDTYPATAPERSALDRYMANQPTKAGVQPVSVRPKFAKGWLTFTSNSERRRLAPIPESWETADERRLREWLLRAEVTGNAPKQPPRDRTR
jgi:hypothetical protein